ncbi:MAG: UDP-N-acetylmuramate--L-alanine ligase [Candidatus Moranbacteria bacterium]|nr:UDP-N-acetylmuramate--L-alanine ligase [Candidatus Moranbacteria bacterium]NTW75595.1 UDP-N-acetylmuramate--L-alanine ligase [Candidatus Moranbacteria bacterium]
MKKKIHFVGIEGAGTSALATLYHRQGYEVTGSDDGDRFYSSVLEREGIPVFSSFHADHVSKDCDVVVYSTAFSDSIEVDRARERGLPILSYPEAIGAMTREKMSLLVTGTHGKTTTSAMLAETLRVAGKDPSAIIGSRVRAWQGNALSGTGDLFVLEADEYQDKLSHYFPFAAILTSVDWDHPDFFPDVEAYRETFRKFIRRIPPHGVLVFSSDSASVLSVASESKSRRISYGFDENADFRIVDLKTVPASESGPEGVRQRFGLETKDGPLGTFELRLPGKHNAQNAAAVVALCSFLRIDMEAVRECLSTFTGTYRRSEYKGEFRGIPVYDDYAHHPEELQVTLSAFRDAYPDKRIVAVFHPHTFTRTAALLSEFAQSFDEAGRVLVLDIYGSAREVAGGVSSADLVREINRYVRDKAEYVPTISEAIEALCETLEPGDLLVTFGAGDVYRVAEGMMEKK